MPFGSMCKSYKDKRAHTHIYIYYVQKQIYIDVQHEAYRSQFSAHSSSRSGDRLWTQQRIAIYPGAPVVVQQKKTHQIRLRIHKLLWLINFHQFPSQVGKALNIGLIVATYLLDLCSRIKSLDFNILAVLSQEWCKDLLNQGMRLFHIGPKSTAWRSEGLEKPKRTWAKVEAFEQSRPIRRSLSAPSGRRIPVWITPGCFKVGRVFRSARTIWRHGGPWSGKSVGLQTVWFMYMLL